MDVTAGASPGRVWAAAVARLGGDPGRSGTELDGRYGEPHRTYHDAAHVRAVLAHVDALAGPAGLDDATRDLVVLAACAHDVVHDGGPDDERASADWAASALRAAGVDAVAAERVAALVLATTDHRSSGDVAADVLCDADLAVLGGSAADYARYLTAVRAEYAHVDDAGWRVGRADVLTALLALPRLYATAVARGRWEAAARAHLTAELADLRGGRPPAR